MSIQTSATPKNSKIREKNSPRMIDSSNVTSSNAPVEVEISIPALLMIIFGLIAVIWGGVYYYNQSQASLPKVEELPNSLEKSLVDVTVSLANLPLEGDSKAEYVFIEYSDFECPFCKMHATGIDPSTGIKSKSSNENIFEKYVDTGIARYAFVSFIGIESHKPAAINESVGLNCAIEQGLAKEYRDIVFEKTFANGRGIDQKGTKDEELYKVVSEIKGDVEKFKECYKKRDIVKIDKMKQEAEKSVRDTWTAKFGEQNFGTPFFVVCKVSTEDASLCKGSAFVGAWPFEIMGGVLDEIMGVAPTQEK